MSESICLQARFAPANTCFGCGQANARGLKLESFPDGQDLVARWRPETHHEAFSGVLNGGIIGTLLDCHGDWTAIWSMMRRDGQESAPCMVTSEFAVTLLRPAPTDRELIIRGRTLELGERHAVVETTLAADGEDCARCRGVFVAVRPGHPAWHAW